MFQENILAWKRIGCHDAILTVLPLLIPNQVRILVHTHKVYYKNLMIVWHSQSHGLQEGILNPYCKTKPSRFTYDLELTML